MYKSTAVWLLAIFVFLLKNKTAMKERKLHPPVGGKSSTALAISFAWELGYSIAVPLVLLALGGRLLDRRFDTEPFLFLAGVLLSIFISTFIVFKKSMRIIASLEKETRSASDKNSTSVPPSGTTADKTGDKKEKSPTDDNSKAPEGDNK